MHSKVLLIAAILMIVLLIGFVAMNFKAQSMGNVLFGDEGLEIYMISVVIRPVGNNPASLPIELYDDACDSILNVLYSVRCHRDSLFSKQTHRPYYDTSYYLSFVGDIENVSIILCNDGSFWYNEREYKVSKSDLPSLLAAFNMTN